EIIVTVREILHRCGKRFCQPFRDSNIATHNRQYREHYERQSHIPWRLVRLGCMFVMLVAVFVIGLLAVERVCSSVPVCYIVPVLRFSETFLSKEGEDHHARHVDGGQTGGHQSYNPEDKA